MVEHFQQLVFNRRLFLLACGKSTGHQAPSTKKTSNTRPQIHQLSRAWFGKLMFDIWSFFGAWILVLGASPLPTRRSFPVFPTPSPRHHP